LPFQYCSIGSHTTNVTHNDKTFSVSVVPGLCTSSSNRKFSLQEKDKRTIGDKEAFVFMRSDVYSLDGATTVRVDEGSIDALEEYLFGVEEIEWISQFDCGRILEVMGGYAGCNCALPNQGNTCCNQASRAILKAEGIELTGERIVIVSTDEEDDCNTTANISEATRGVEVLNNNLDDGKPVMVGVQKFKWSNDDLDYSMTNCSGNTPSSAVHYVVIVSRQGNNYRFYEVGRSQAYKNEATSPNNIFTLQNNLLETGVINSKKYRITDIRVNK